MENKKKDDYIVLFKTVKLSKRQANKVGLGFISGAIGVLVAILITGGTNKIISYLIITIFFAVGYFWIGNKIFKT